MPYGHALLVGLGGSGRKTLTRLASYMQDYKLFEPSTDINYIDWLDYLRELFK